MTIPVPVLPGISSLTTDNSAPFLSPTPAKAVPGDVVIPGSSQGFGGPSSLEERLGSSANPVRPKGIPRTVTIPESSQGFSTPFPVDDSPPPADRQPVESMPKKELPESSQNFGSSSWMDNLDFPGDSLFGNNTIKEVLSITLFLLHQL